jgi:membrane protease YdiL (CAAX protease family)
VLLWAVALMLHLIPGFTNLKVLDQVQAGPASVPFNMYLNLDKPLVFFGLLLAWPALLGPGGAVQWRRLALLLVPLAALLVAAWQLGPSNPRWACPLVVAVCPQQPAVHLRGGRGAVSRLPAAGVAAHSRRWLGVLVASLLFGAAHLAGGPLLVLFAALAGPAMAWRSC